MYCSHVVGLFDTNNDGTINLQEFQQLWQYIGQWKGVFDRYDKDRSGNIDASELLTGTNVQYMQHNHEIQYT